MYSARDLRLARRAKKAGAEHSLRIVLEARKADIPISLGFALVEQESNFKNIFGCDRGSILCHAKVTKERVKQLLKHISAGGVSNGIGLTQLTWPPYIRQAERMGGAHIPRNQIAVGFAVLGGLIDQHGVAGGLATFNAGAPLAPAGKRYAREVLEKQDRWHKILK